VNRDQCVTVALITWLIVALCWIVFARTTTGAEEVLTSFSISHFDKFLRYVYEGTVFTAWVFAPLLPITVFLAIEDVYASHHDWRVVRIVWKVTVSVVAFVGVVLFGAPVIYLLWILSMTFIGGFRHPVIIALLLGPTCVVLISFAAYLRSFSKRLTTRRLKLPNGEAR